MPIVEHTARSALHRLTRPGLPYHWDLNIYRGCSHKCRYCYAVKSHRYLTDDPDTIFAKMNIAEALDRELSSPAWRGDIINIGGVCDSYQPAEGDCRIMPGVLRVLIKHRQPVIISTKSDLILRDIALIDTLARHTYVNIAACITTADKAIAAKVEPGASSPRERFNMLCELGKTRARTALHIMPVLPFLADGEESLESLVRMAADADVDYLLAGLLYLRGDIKPRYIDFISSEYPRLLPGYLALYRSGRASLLYKARIHSRLAVLRQRFGVSSDYRSLLPRVARPA